MKCSITEKTTEVFTVEKKERKRAPRKNEGAPSKYTPKYATDLLRIIRKRKCTIPYACLEMGIDFATAKTWSKDPRKPEFCAAYKKAKDFQKENIIQSMVDGSINPVAGIFLLKCNHKFIEHEKERALKLKEKELAARLKGVITDAPNISISFSEATPEDHPGQS